MTFILPFNKTSSIKYFLYFLDSTNLLVLTVRLLNIMIIVFENQLSAK